MIHKNIYLPVIIASIAGFFVGTYYHRQEFPSVQKAVAVVYPTKGNTVEGTVTFTQEPQGVKISARLKGLTPGDHGFHIHEFGNCACDDAQCAGDHFNPTRNRHAGPRDANRHVGDLGNIHADENGNGTYEELDTAISLEGPHSIIGRAVIIHEKADDLHSQPSGDSGARVAAGVIGIASTVQKKP